MALIHYDIYDSDESKFHRWIYDTTSSDDEKHYILGSDTV
jgi:hypothetical protein